MSIHELILNAQGFLGRNLKEIQSPEEQELFRVARAALSFISETGAVYPFEDYLRLRKDAPPYAVASFKTREDAEAWLQQHAEPPHGAFVLIADDYYIVMYVRELGNDLPKTRAFDRGDRGESAGSDLTSPDQEIRADGSPEA